MRIDFALPNQKPVAEQASVDPNLMIAAEHPMHLAAAQLDSRDLRLEHFPAGSSQEAAPVVPAVANQKRPQRLLVSSFHYCEIAVAQRLE